MEADNKNFISQPYISRQPPRRTYAVIFFMGKETPSYLLATYLKANSPDKREWARQKLLKVLAIPGEPINEIRPIFKDLANKYHPDKGGNEEAMKALNEFWERIKFSL